MCGVLLFFFHSHVLYTVCAVDQVMEKCFDLADVEIIKTPSHKMLVGGVDMARLRPVLKT